MNYCPWIGVAVLMSPVLIGCSRGPSRVYPPSVNSDAGSVAVEQYDKNGDHSLSAAELRESPGLLAAFARLDVNKDGAISAEEIDARVQSWKESRIGLSSMDARVFYNGRPMPGAEIVLEPEVFLGEAVKQASGTTDERGFATVRISPDPDEDGVHLGFYRVRVSKQVGGKETIPAYFNEQTELGAEVAHDVMETQNYKIDLRSR